MADLNTFINIGANTANFVGDITATNLGNVSAVDLNGNANTVLAGDGTWVTPSAGSTYGDANVSAYLAGGTNANGFVSMGNVSVGGNLSVTGNIISNITYGAFYDTTTQTNSNVGNAIPVSYNTVDINSGVTIAGAGNTNITIAKAGIYNIQFSLQLSKSDSGNDVIYIWLDKNGTSVPESATDVTLIGNGGKQVAAWNFVVSAAANDYYRLMWMSTDTNASIIRVTNPAPVPTTPSVILTVVPVGA
jgi:hypothetical protein